MSSEYAYLDQNTLDPMDKDSGGFLYRVTVEGGNKMVEAINEYYIILSTDKMTISGDGSDSATIKAKLYKYTDEPQVTDNSTIIAFNLNNQNEEITQICTNGEATITFSSSEPGEYVIFASTSDAKRSDIKVVAQ